MSVKQIHRPQRDLFLTIFDWTGKTKDVEAAVARYLADDLASLGSAAPAAIIGRVALGRGRIRVTTRKSTYAGD